MKHTILHQTKFRSSGHGWNLPETGPRVEVTKQGLLLCPGPKATVGIDGSGVHTRNNDSVELHFRLLEKGKGNLWLGFSGFSEHANVILDFAKKKARLKTSEWNRPQPVRVVGFALQQRDTHVLRLEKSEGAGCLVKMADIRVVLDGKELMVGKNVNVMPEMGVSCGASGTRVLFRRFVHRGQPSGIPEFLHIGAWQMLNTNVLEYNLQSIFRGLREAAQRGVRLLVTPETSLTGLFPTDSVTRNRKAILRAEAKLRRFMKGLRKCPHVVIGLPVWEQRAEHARTWTRYNASRVYDPQGNIVATCPKIHSCETEFWHGYRLNEFDVCGVPVSMHICHDGRYPETWVLPAMFGTRLIVHPANPVEELKSRPAIGKGKRMCITTQEREDQKGITGTSHAFYLTISGGGGYIASPHKPKELKVERNKWLSGNGEVMESLVHANIRVPDAFGFWPVRSFRASEQVAEAYLNLYRSLGGKRVPTK